MRVLLTGAAGFFGSRAASHLADHEVIGVDRPGVDRARLSALASSMELREIELVDATAVEALVRDVRPDVAIHLAWYAVPGKYLAATENMDHLAAAMVLARALAKAGCRRLLTAGTCFEYDTTQGVLSESARTAPRFLYSACKLAMFEVLREACKLSGMSYAHLRFFYQYGPWEAQGRLVPAVIGALLAGEEAKVTLGEQIRDFLHVDDVASAIAAVTASDLEGVVNVGSGIPVRVCDVVMAAAEACGRPELVRLGALPHREGDPAHVCAEVAKLRSTGWKPSQDLSSGMRDTVAWWRTQEAKHG
jgi:nucleoside-diphosphate-sugar epimerase